MPDRRTARTLYICDDCGICCMHMAVPPYSDEEQEALRRDAPDVYDDLMGVARTRRLQLRATGADSVPCGFLDPVTRKCRHHNNVPDICDQFGVGCPACLKYRKVLLVSALETFATDLKAQ